MPDNRSELLTKLENLTQPPEGAGLEWLDYQIAQMEAPKGEHAHMISVQAWVFPPT